MNDQYISLLRQHARMNRDPKVKGNYQHERIQTMLLNQELKMTSEEIIENTKLAFPGEDAPQEHSVL